MKNKFILLTMLMSMAMISCQKDTKNPDSSDGQKAYLSVSVRVASSKATKVKVSITEEEKIDKVSLYIISEGVVESITSVTLNTGGVASETIATKAGDKKVYAIANPTVPMSSIASGMAIADFEKFLVSAKHTDIAVDNKFVMIGSSEVTVAAPVASTTPVATPVAISVSRVAAKVIVGIKNPVMSTPGAASWTGTFTLPKFTLANTTKQRFLTNTTATTFSPSNGSVVGVYGNIDGIPAQNIDWKTVLTSPGVHTWLYTRTHSGYVGENKNAVSLNGNTTCVLLEMIYTPAASEYKGVGDLVGKTFYAVVQNNNTLYLYKTTEEANKDTLAATNGVKTYVDGKCYYRLDIKNDGLNDYKYSISPNHLYQIDISAIKTIGGSKPGENGGGVTPTPDEPVEEGGSIEATITVVDWTTVVIEEPIG